MYTEGQNQNKKKKRLQEKENLLRKLKQNKIKKMRKTASNTQCATTWIQKYKEENNDDISIDRKIEFKENIQPISPTVSAYVWKKNGA